MIKLLIVNCHMKIGGIQRALINLLQGIDYSKYQVDLYLFGANGDYMGLIPPEVHIIKAPKILRVLGVSQTAQTKKAEGVFFYLFRGFCSLISKIFGRQAITPLLVKNQKKLNGYDVAISYMQNPSSRNFFGGCNEFVLDRVNAPKKITFLHADFLLYGGNNKFNRKQYPKFDTIVPVSNGAKKSLLTVMPELKDKVVVMPNLYDYDYIAKVAREDTFVYDKQFFNIVTVSRLSCEKGLNRCVGVIRELIDSGYKIKWHVIGDGNDREAFFSERERLRLTEDIVVYGNQANPYKYMLNADLFMLPSFQEAGAMVLKEALSLKVPALSTETISSEEQVDKSFGYICENSVDGISATLRHILTNQEELLEKRQNLQSYHPNNDKAITIFEEITK